MCSRINKIMIALFGLLAAVVFLTAVPVSASDSGSAADGRCVVYFYNNSGTALFDGGRVRVAAGETITLPNYRNRNFINYGWTTSPGSTKVKYKIGKEITVTENMKLYLVRRRKMTVDFYGASGTSSRIYQELALKTGKGRTVTLPQVPYIYGWQSLGWATQANAASADYAAGQTIKVTKNLALYAVRRKLPTYQVRFNNNQGTSTSTVYSSLNTKAVKNTRITLPEVPKVSGYQGVGWTTTRGGTSPVYKAGSQVRITEATSFYAVRRKSNYYTVRFLLGDGRTSTAYRELTQTVEEGTVITFPSVPDRKGYVNLGWSTVPGASSPTKKAGSRGTINKNYIFYAVQKAELSVTLCKNNGAEYKSVTVTEGSSYVLPSVANAAGYTFMGWSKKPNQTVNPDYEAGETIQVNAAVRLYAVVFNRSTEPNLTRVSKLDTSKYRSMIFVGDSRTVYMSNTMAEIGAAGNVSYVCKGSMGLEWLKSTAYSRLLKILDSMDEDEKPVAVVFNFGVNDLSNISSYISYMKKIAPELKSRGCVLFYESVNPVNKVMNELSGCHPHEESDVRSFNRQIRAALCTAGDYNYIDTYHYLMKTGFGTSSELGVDDGLHYTHSTYKRIYEYCMRRVNNT